MLTGLTLQATKKTDAPAKFTLRFHTLICIRDHSEFPCASVVRIIIRQSFTNPKASPTNNTRHTTSRGSVAQLNQLNELNKPNKLNKRYKLSTRFIELTTRSAVCPSQNSTSGLAERLFDSTAFKLSSRLSKVHNLFVP